MRNPALLAFVVFFGCGSEGAAPLVGGLDERPVLEACTAQLALPERLSESACFVGSPPRPAPELVPYEPRAPLWTDGSDKERHLLLPPGTEIEVAANGSVELPVGGVLIKSFGRGGDYYETRIIVRGADGLRFATYRWQEDGSDALRLRDGGEGPEGWQIPSEADCRRCHSPRREVLGIEPAQLGGSVVYAATGRSADQLETLAAIGFMDASPSVFVPDYTDHELPVAERARAYLHGNCSHCHRPGGQAVGAMDFRYRATFEALGIENVMPEFGDPTGADGRLLVPGQPERSIVLERLGSADPYQQMPPLGVQAPDPLGVDVLRRWIEAL